MAKGRKRVCVLCGLTIEDNNDSIPYKNRYAHIACFRAAAKAIHVDKTEKVKKKEAEKKTKPVSKPKAELKDALSDEEYNLVSNSENNQFKFKFKLIEFFNKTPLITARN